MAEDIFALKAKKEHREKRLLIAAVLAPGGKRPKGWAQKAIQAAEELMKANQEEES